MKRTKPSKALIDAGRKIGEVDAKMGRWFIAMMSRWPDSAPHNLLRNERAWEKRRARNRVARASRRRNR